MGTSIYERLGETDKERKRNARSISRRSRPWYLRFFPSFAFVNCLKISDDMADLEGYHGNEMFHSWFYKHFGSSYRRAKRILTNEYKIEK